jgi:hypothetical protein
MFGKATYPWSLVAQLVRQPDNVFSSCSTTNAYTVLQGLCMAFMRAADAAQQPGHSLVCDDEPHVAAHEGANG